MADVKDAHRALTDRVIDLDGVTGTAIGEKDGRACLKVYVARRGKGLLGSIPDSVKGVPVVVEETGTIRPR